MFELLVVILFCWFSVKAIGIALTLTWGAANDCIPHGKEKSSSSS